MKKILNIILVITCFFIGIITCDAKENVIVSDFERREDLITVKLTGTNVYGMIADIKYDSKIVQFDGCVNNNTYIIKTNRNRLVIDNYKVTGLNELAICNFKVLDKEKDSKIIFENITYSDSKSLKENVNLEGKIVKGKELVVDIQNSNKTYIITAISLVATIALGIIVCFILRKVKQKKRIKKMMIVILSIILLPLTCFALVGDFNNNLKIEVEEIDSVRDYLLGLIELTNDQIKLADIDSDKIISIHDLVLMKIEQRKPVIEFVSETEGTAKYFTKVLNKITVSTLDDITNLSYCITTEKNCEPNNAVSGNGLLVNFEIEYPDNESPQRVCVTAKTSEGYDSKICDTKTYLVDSKKPEIVFRSNLVTIEEIYYDPFSNIQSKVVGSSGGEVVCDTAKNLSEGLRDIKCTLTAGNGLTYEGTFKLDVAVTKNKTAVFYGDSITQGVKNENKSWADYIGANYNLESALNHGKSGWLISNARNKNWINTVVVGDKDFSFDFVVLHGGCNDVAYNAQIGSFIPGDFSGNYDATTFLGGLETYLYTVTTQWPNAKIGYIITYQTPNNTDRKPTKASPYYEQMRLVLKKWNVPYIDLFSGTTKDGVTYSDLLKVNTTEYLPDNLHLNGAGYNVISPYIYEWMRTLPSYSR